MSCCCRRLIGSLLAWGALVTIRTVSLATAAPAAPATTTDVLPVPDEPFPQEVAVRLPAEPGLGTNRVQVLEIAPEGAPRAFADGRWFGVRDGRWTALEGLACRTSEAFVFPDATGQPVTVPLKWADVIQVIRRGGTNWIVTARDPYQVVDGQLSSMGWPSRFEIRQVAVSPSGALWIASNSGLFRQRPDGWSIVGIGDGQGRGWAVSDVRGLTFDREGRLWVALPAGVVTGDGDRDWRFFEGRDGVPYTDFTWATAGDDGAIWLGTKRGAIRFDGRNWAYRQGPRWVPSDGIRRIAVDARGGAWLATDRGLGAIERRPMTLAQKAAFYEDEVERYIKRTPYGYTSEVGLAGPGDRSKVTYSDSDNDGLWTGMYGAGECFAYAATKQPEFQRRARQAFEALRFLQKVTQEGSPKPPKGFVARTIRPTDWPDPNLGRLDADRRDREHGDRLWKVYEPRWPKTSDGQWYWKSDTSSDELDGHYFFYGRYFDLVADDAEKDRVRDVVRDLTDHLIEHGFCLVDHDGTPTRWGIFGPEYLNRDPRWWLERGLNSLSMLSYLAVAEHVTGDPRYAEASRRLIEEHGYASNVMNPKAQSGPGSGNQSDDEMAFMCFYNLLSYTRETAWRSRWLYAFHSYAALEHPEMNPFFHFAHAAHARGRTYANPWGDFSTEPWAGWLADSLTTLRGFPLDRANWPHRNSHRLDLVRLPLQQSIDLYSPDRDARGHRVNGRVLPVEERHFGHWNTDPWRLDYGGDGRELASGTVFLLPYYMGLYHGYIAPPKP